MFCRISELNWFRDEGAGRLQGSKKGGDSQKHAAGCNFILRKTQPPCVQVVAEIGRVAFPPTASLAEKPWS